MRVAFDARELEGHPTGVGRVLEGLVGAWPGEDELVLVARTRPGGTLPEGCRVVLEPGPAWLPGSLWEQTRLPRAVRRLDADALVCPAYGMPWLSPCPTAVGMHDCAFAALPGTFRPRERLRRRSVARIAARRAAVLFMGSEFAAAEARRHLGVEPSRLLVLAYGVDRRFRPADTSRIDEVRRRYDLPPRPVLFAGSHLARRRLPGLAEALAGVLAPREGAELCMVGIRPQGAGDPVLAADERWLGYVPDADLPALYSAASALVYPSHYEGFGLPVMEALACGTPVLTSDTAALAEVYRGRAALLPVARPDAWARALARLLDEPDAHAAETGAAAEWARQRNWSAAARTLRDRLARGHGDGR